ncbi:hypothetical protein Tco_1505211 [Tanacetum coccineum]
MAAPGGANQIARRVIDDLIKFNGETSVDGYMSFFKSQQIAESRGFINRMPEEANTAKNLAEKEIKTKEAQELVVVFEFKYALVRSALLWIQYGSILNILQGRNELLEKIIGCVVDSGGVPELDPKVSDIWGIMETKANNLDHLVNYDNDNDIENLGYKLEVYLNDEEEDENNQSNGNVVKRGITRLSKFRRKYGKPNGIKLSVTFDALNRISRPHRALFSSFLGDLVCEHMGLKIISWKKVGSEARDKLWDEIMVKSAAAKMARSKSIYQHTMRRGGYVHVKQKMKETEDKIKEGTLKVDHGPDAMTVILGKEKGGYARGVGNEVTYKRYFDLPRSRQASDEKIALLQSQLDNERRERQ